jgi:hypothetical protein
MRMPSVTAVDSGSATVVGTVRICRVTRFRATCMLRRMRGSLLLALPFVLAFGCDGGGSSSGDDTDVPDADPNAPDALPGDWIELIASSWTISPGEEYQCERLTVTEDIWIKAFRSDGPLGSHHSVLTVGDAGSDGTFPCGAGDNEPAMIYGAGVNTNDIAMPDGVAMKVPAGSQLNLNLHLFNTQPTDELSGTSRVLIQVVPESEIAGIVEAEVVLMGPLTFTVPEGNGQDINGQCTMSGATNLFMVNPHMHQLGVHQLVIADRAAGDMMIHDGDYDFSDQRIYPITPIAMAAGDRVMVTCTYDNDSGDPVPFGDSSTQEMCFATTYRYPALGGTFGIFCPT